MVASFERHRAERQNQVGIVTTGTAFVARFTLVPAKREEFIDAHRQLMSQAGPFMEQETYFVFYGWGRDENEFVAIEAWKDEGTLNALRAQPDFQAGVKRLLACCTAPVEISLWSGTTAPRFAFELYPRGASQVHPSLTPTQRCEFR